MESKNLLLDFWITVTMNKIQKHAHLLMFGDNPKIVLDISGVPGITFENGVMYEVNDTEISLFVPRMKEFSKERFTYEEIMLDILQRIVRNETESLKVVYACDTVKRFTSVFETTAFITSQRRIPYHILYDTRLLTLQFATDKFLFYDDCLEMPVMIRTTDGSIVSNNEFANIGFYQSLDAVQEGKEKQVIFTKLPCVNMSSFVEKCFGLSVPVSAHSQLLVFDSSVSENADELPF